MAPLNRRRLLTTLLAGPVLANPLLATAAHASARPEEDAHSALWSGLDLQDQSGSTFQLRQAATPVTVVAFWAHWCQPCLAELPALVAMAATLGSRAEVVLMSYPEYWEEDVALARRRQVPLRLVTPAASNGQPTIRAALLNRQGEYRVPRTLTFHTAQNTVAWRNYRT